MKLSPPNSSSQKKNVTEKILKYQEIIKNINEAILVEDDITFKSDYEDFEELFKKLASGYKHDICRNYSIIVVVVVGTSVNKISWQICNYQEISSRITDSRNGV